MLAINNMRLVDVAKLILTLLVLYQFLPSTAYAAYDSAAANAAKNLQIIRITPDGADVPAGKQIVIQFNRPVVPIGRMERDASEVPVIISPALQCEWRWINISALACNLPDNAALKESTRYTIDIKPGISTEDGTTIAKTYSHSFITARPDIVYRQFVQWKSPGYPVIRLSFNQPVSKESVEQHVFLIAGDNLKKRVALKASKDPNDGLKPYVIPIMGEKIYALLFKHQPKNNINNDSNTSSSREARSVWIVEPTRELPLNANVILRTEAGIASAIGSERSVASGDVVSFDTYPEFEFLGLKCKDNTENTLTIKAGQVPDGKCNPMEDVHLSFSTPVARGKLNKMISVEAVPADTKKTSLQTPEAKESKETKSDEVESQNVDYSRYTQPHKKGRTYEVSLPGGLKAAQEYIVQSRSQTMNIFKRSWHSITSLGNGDPIEVRDIFGRELRNPISSRFATDHRNPNFVLDYRYAVLEKGIDSEIPFYVNNIKNYTFNYRKVTANDSAEGLVFRKDVPDVKDIRFAVPFGVREMLGGKSGAIYGTLNTEPSLAPQELFAQVTPYQVHLKLGHFNTVVWVTEMGTGAPVSGAKVSLYRDKFDTIKMVQNASFKATTDQNGIAVLDGTDKIDPELNINKYDDDANRYFLRVEKGEDMALLPVAQSFIIDAYRSSGSEMVWPSNKKLYGHMRTWGTTAQGIYRAGDTIQYKIYVRNQGNNSLIQAPDKGYRLKVIDPMGKVVHDVRDIKLSSFGGISGEFAIPKEGTVGWYKFKLIANFAKQSVKDYDESADESEEEETSSGADGRNNEDVANDDSKDKQSWIAMRVLVSDFTPSPFKVSNQLNGDLFHSEEQVEVSTRAELHSGGAYTDASARITAVLDSADFVPKNPVAKNFNFSSYESEADRYVSSSQHIFQKIDKVNDKGELALNFSTGAPDIIYGKLLVESAVADERGKYITSQSRADYVGVDRLVGLYVTEWIYNVGKPATVKYIVVDDRGNPVKGTAVDITIEHEVTKASRVKGAGNAYLTEYNSEWQKAGACAGISEVIPQDCTFKPEKAGSYRINAVIKDTKGRSHASIIETYAAGADFIMWDNGSDSSLTIVPERTDYKVGETARYLVKNPYPNAKALITVERYGVIDHFVQTFDSSTPVIELKIKPDYLPGFYLSVVVISPRVDKPPAEDGQVDLGKPTYRMGYIKVPVKDPYKEMLITAKSDREVYKPREKVTVNIHAEPRIRDKNEPVELAVAVLDESVLDLIADGKGYFDPYAGFYKLDSLDVNNYSLLTRLVGRQRFEKKGANPGGDGGADLSMRSLFKFVSYWNPALMTDKNGNATVSFEAPDNLTGWRILVIATTPSDRFGLGEANFKVNRPTEVRPVMPNQVMEGDTFDAGFSIMNRTDKPRTLNVKIHADGNIDTAKTPANLSKTITLEPYRRANVMMPIKTTSVDMKSDIKAGKLRFTVSASDEFDRDGIEHIISVNKQRSLEVAANYGTTTEDKIEENIKFPKEMLTDVGSVSVVASPTVIGNLAGAFKYMSDYPYICWEQKLTKGVMAAHYKNLKAYLPDSFSWQESDALPQEILSQAATFQAPNGGMAYFVANDSYVDPYLSAYTAIAFNWLRKSGYSIPEQVENKLQTYLNNMLKNNAVPDFYSEGMTSTVRAVALAALAERGKSDLSDLERYQPHVQKMSLFGKSYFLQAALAVQGGEKYAQEAANMILSSSNQTGGKFIFSEVLDDSYTRILSSPLRENCAILDAFTIYGEREGGKDLVGDVPFKLVRTITQGRKSSDRWENTQENMFCMNALINFARVYEKDKPNMVISAALDGQTFGNAQFKDVRDPAASLERPIKEGDQGRSSVVQIERKGAGRLYYSARLAYALPVEMSRAANAGIEVRREYSVERNGDWVLLDSPAQIKRGELVRVDLFVSVPAARNFVVVDDPVPGGLEPVNRDLANASEIDARKAEFRAAGGSFWFRFSDWNDFGLSRWSFYHKEIRHDAVRFYADYLPAGNYHLSYAAQAIATGTFSALPTIAAEMYDEDVYGKTEALSLHIGENENTGIH